MESPATIERHGHIMRYVMQKIRISSFSQNLLHNHKTAFNISPLIVVIYAHNNESYLCYINFKIVESFLATKPYMTPVCTISSTGAETNTLTDGKNDECKKSIIICSSNSSFSFNTAHTSRKLLCCLLMINRNQTCVHDTRNLIELKNRLQILEYI